MSRTSPIVVLSDGGLKATVAGVSSAGGEGGLPITFFCLDSGSGLVRRGFAAVTEFCRRWTGADCVRWTVSPADAPAAPPTAPACVPPERARFRPDSAAPGPGGSLGLLPAALALGVHFAIRCGAERIVTGLSQTSDEALLGAPNDQGRPDRRKEFLHAFNCMLETALPASRRVAIEAPLMDLCYEDIVRLGHRFEVPFEHTWSCETEGRQACATCPSCRARAAAFASVNLIDPSGATPVAPASTRR